MAVPNPAYQPSGVLRASTIALILSVTVPNVWPGAITAGVRMPAARLGSSTGCRLSAILRYAEATQSGQRTQRVISHGDTETQRCFEQEIKRSEVVLLFKREPPVLL